MTTRTLRRCQEPIPSLPPLSVSVSAKSHAFFARTAGASGITAPHSVSNSASNHATFLQLPPRFSERYRPPFGVSGIKQRQCAAIPPSAVHAPAALPASSPAFSDAALHLSSNGSAFVYRAAVQATSSNTYQHFALHNISSDGVDSHMQHPATCDTRFGSNTTLQKQRPCVSSSPSTMALHASAFTLQQLSDSATTMHQR